ncbi:DUF4349 domain-containing protein [Streptomyces thermocarboxydovorans]|uniref:DUF4349 domain-containing protein n=2 Tax=Streptomyces thermocarboxydovorans TaxID=59298 RepID=A0ABN1HWM5_9ACTN
MITDPGDEPMRTRRSVRPAHALAGVLLAAALALTGCSGANDDSGGKSAAQDDRGAAAPEGAGQGASGADGARATAPPAAPPKQIAGHVIRTAELTVQVKDTREALAEARTATENAGGYVGDETTSRDSRGHGRTRVVLRAPAEKYEEVLADLEGTGRLVRREAKAEDVTDQVVDVESRIKSQRASVARIRELMDRATKLSDVVTLEGELSSRQADLEALLARQKSLKDRTSLATITLTLSEKPVKKAEGEDEDPGFLDALAGGWDAFVTMLRWIVVAVGAVLPFAALLVLLILLWRKVVRPRLPQPAPAAAVPGPRPAGPASPPAPAEGTQSVQSTKTEKDGD